SALATSMRRRFDRCSHDQPDEDASSASCATRLDTAVLRCALAGISVSWRGRATDRAATDSAAPAPRAAAISSIESVQQLLDMRDLAELASRTLTDRVSEPARCQRPSP